MSNDPNDWSYLTPGHFLIGMPLTSPVGPDFTELNVNRLSRYQLLEWIKQHFCSLWSKAYLHNLQVRSKWKTNNNNRLRVEDLVMIKEDHLPPLQWLTGRIIELHLGEDHITTYAMKQANKGRYFKIVFVTN
ncbi:hypothetical protein Trydic_g1183 [Trypoxylus dichotomus]